MISADITRDIPPAEPWFAVAYFLGALLVLIFMWSVWLPGRERAGAGPKRLRDRTFLTIITGLWAAIFVTYVLSNVGGQ